MITGGNRRYTLFRNKFPRPAGQGASRQVYGLLGISGSQTGGQGVIDISIPELVQSSQTGISSTWPLNIPGSGKQTEYKLNVPRLQVGAPRGDVRVNNRAVSAKALHSPWVTPRQP